MKACYLALTLTTILVLTPVVAAHEPPPDPSESVPETAPEARAPEMTAELEPQTEKEPAPDAETESEGRRALRAQTGVVESEELQPRVAAVSGSPVYTHVTTNNTRHEIESAITAVTINSTDHTAGAYMREVNDVFRIHTISSTTPSNSGLFHWQRQTPSLPTDHEESVDPVLDVNPYTTGQGPTRIHLGGLTYALDSQNRRILPEAITTWRSDNGGQSWLAPVTVESNSTSNFSLDKPDIAVSWYSLSRGYVYVAYVKVKVSGSTFVNELWIARSTNGGASYPSKFHIATGHIQAPQVVVSSNTGKVYVIWVDLDDQQLKLASSPHNAFTSWTNLPSLNAVGRFLSPCEFGVCDPIAAPGASNCTTGIQAVTVPHARYNWIKDQIGVVWHERETDSGTATTDVFFSAFTASGWLTPKRVNPVQVRDQWYPALDFDTTGDYLVVFYDRSQDTTNLLYREAWAHINSSGTRLNSGFVASVFDSDPSEVYSPGSLCFKGEYQDVWFWGYSDADGPRFHALWTGHPVSATNVDDEVQLSAVK